MMFILVAGMICKIYSFMHARALLAYTHMYALDSLRICMNKKIITFYRDDGIHEIEMIHVI